MDNNKYVIIMAGGIGSRFWPLSRQDKPKQFLDILGTGETLIQQTYRRFKDICPENNIFIVTGADQRELVLEQLKIDPSKVLGEPFRRNTAPCLAYGAFRILKENPNAVIAVTPADHLITQEDKFKEEIIKCFDFAANYDALLTIGITPNRPETGYGYIQADKKKSVKEHEGIIKVKTFTEKPDIDLAKMFIQSGDFSWNSGIFIWNVNSVLAAFEKYMPETYSVFDEGRELFGTEHEKNFISKAYAVCKSISIDYGIMEKADNVYVMCTDFGWSDLGTWGSLYEHIAHDETGNAIVSGEVFSYDNNRNIINISSGKLAVIQGLSDYIIVDSNDALLIVRKEDEQRIKDYLDDVLKASKGKYL
jgi:mannose-1-phosphate guanylyltransferase